MYKQRRMTIKELCGLEITDPLQDLCRLFTVQYIAGEDAMLHAMGQLQMASHGVELPDVLQSIKMSYSDFVDKYEEVVPGLMVLVQDVNKTTLTCFTFAYMFLIHLSIAAEKRDKPNYLLSLMDLRVSNNDSEYLQYCSTCKFDDCNVSDLNKEIPIEMKADIHKAMADGLLAFLLCKSRGDDFIYEQCDMMLKKKESEQRKLISKYTDKINALKQTKAVEVTKEVVVRDTRIEAELYDELSMLRNRVTELEDKIARYKLTVSEEDYQVLDDLYTEQQESVDLSGYKILIVGSDSNKEAYPFPYIDVGKNTTISSKVDYVDYVLFDTRFNSHTSYYSIKSRCKKHNIPLFHINCRNKDIIISEAKRLISTCKR